MGCAFIKTNKLGPALTVFSIPFFIFVMINFGLPLLKDLCPSCFTFLNQLYIDYGILLYVYPLFVWYIYLILYFGLKLYIIYCFSLHKSSDEHNNEKEKIIISKYLPNSLSNWVLDLNKDYKEAVEEEKIFGYNWLIKINLINITACFILLFI